jgi:hypothetical protein
MRFLTPFRLATYLLALYAAAHTLGGMLSGQSFGPASDAVVASMKAVSFDFNGSSSTWYGFWFGFGLMVSIFLFFSAVTAWQLEKVGPESWPAVSVVAWALVASHVCNAFLSFTYFFAAPGTFATMISILLAVGTVRKQRAFQQHPLALGQG